MIVVFRCNYSSVNSKKFFLLFAGTFCTPEEKTKKKSADALLTFRSSKH